MGRLPFGCRLAENAASMMNVLKGDNEFALITDWQEKYGNSEFDELFVVRFFRRDSGFNFSSAFSYGK